MASGSVEVLWSRRLHLRAQVMAVSAGSLVVAERHSRLVRLDPASGEPGWDQRVEDCWGTAVIAGDRCLYLSGSGVLHCLDLATGQRLWSTPGLDLCRHVTVSGDVAFLGGWRGYRPLTRVSLADGARLPLTEAAAVGPLAWPLPLRLRPRREAALRSRPGQEAALTLPPDQEATLTLPPDQEATLTLPPDQEATLTLRPKQEADDQAVLGADDHAVLIAGTGRSALLMLAASGAVVGEWQLPEPIRFPDGEAGYSVSADGRITFLSGSRTVMAFDPVHGPRVLWRHPSDIRPFPPLLDGQTLWLIDTTGIAVITLTRGVVAHIKSRPVVAADRAWFALADGSLITVDRSGDHRTVAPVLPRVDRLAAGEGDLIHAVGKGRVITFRLNPEVDSPPGPA